MQAVKAASTGDMCARNRHETRTKYYVAAGTPFSVSKPPISLIKILVARIS